MARVTLETKLATTQHTLGIAKKMLREAEAKRRPDLKAAEKEEHEVYKAQTVTVKALEREQQAALKRSGLTNGKALTRLRKFAGLTPDDVKGNAHEVPGHDLLMEAVSVVQHWVYATDEKCKAASKAYAQAHKAYNRASHQVRCVQDQTREEQRAVRRLEDQVRELKAKIVKRDDARNLKRHLNKGTTMTPKEARVLDTRRKEGRRRLRAIAEKEQSHWNRHATPKIDPETLKALGLTK